MVFTVVWGTERGAKADADATSMMHEGRNFMVDESLAPDY
jgi:hypothetical protein